eukprot:TRINITY_DN36144_c0_g1_i1.p1 TRINITY_DN36144_c0_g1~~TRINITY_DN36144_c0_g1_i1.p1  ORF type:complete len:740 (-),score=209.04 TRINITY_DN36144_c0_g1_i1:2-2221(-)
MSWISSTVNRVRDRGADLVKESVQAIRHQVNHARATFSRGPAPGSQEHAADLERKVRKAIAAASVTGPAELDAQIGAWVRLLEVGNNGDLQRQREANGLRQALLRGHALEMIVEAIATDSQLRRHYSQAAAWKAMGLPGLLSQTLECPEAVWAPLLRLVFGDSDLLSEHHVQWLVQIVGALRADWCDDDFKGERRELNLHAENLIQELRQSLDGDDSDRSHSNRVDLSLELFSVYRAMHDNIQEAQAQLSDSTASRDKELARIDQELVAYTTSLADPANSFDERNRQLQQELQQSHDLFQAEMQRLDEEREKMDRSIEELDAKKRELKLRLEGTASGLQAAQADQRAHMQQCDTQHAALNKIEFEFRTNLRAEDAIIKEAQQHRGVVDRTLHIIGEVEAVVEQAVRAQVEDLRNKQHHFDLHFKEILQDHVDLEEQHHWFLQKEAEACKAAVLKHKSQIEMLNVMDMSTKSVVDADDRRRLQRTIDAADAAREELAKFWATFGEMLEGTEAENLVWELDARQKALQQTIAPCRELVPAKADGSAPSLKDRPPPAAVTTPGAVTATPTLVRSRTPPPQRATTPPITPTAAAQAQGYQSGSASATPPLMLPPMPKAAFDPSPRSSNNLSSPPTASPMPLQSDASGGQTTPRQLVAGASTPLARNSVTPPLPVAAQPLPVTPPRLVTPPVSPRNALQSSSPSEAMSAPQPLALRRHKTAPCIGEDASLARDGDDHHVFPMSP